MSHIKNIEIKNFKSIRHAKIEDCRRVNVFIGYPNVGKSNILEAMSLMSFVRARQRPIGLHGLVRYERLTQLFNYGNIKSPFEICWDKKYTMFGTYDDENYLRLSLNHWLEDNYAKASAFASGISIGRKSISELKVDEIDRFSGRYNELKDFQVKSYKFSDSKNFDQTFSAIDLGVPFGDNLFEVISNNPEILNEFKELVTPYGLDLLIDNSNNNIRISKQVESGIIFTMPISMIADTIIRLIFHKTALLSNSNAAILFEEPETHMFPPYITNFTTDIIFDKNNNQYFIATHSPFVLSDFMEDMEKNDLSIYAIGLKKGETVVRRLTDEEINEVNQYGIDLFFNLESYLKDGFFNNA